MRPNIFLLFSVLVTVHLKLIYAQTPACSITNAFTSPNLYNIQFQATSGFCKEYVVGTINAVQGILINFINIGVICEAGDKLKVLNEDRSSVIFDYCSPSTSKVAFSENSYLIIQMLTNSNRMLSVSFNYYSIAVNPTTTTARDITSTTSPTTTKTSTTYPTLSTASTLTTTAAKISTVSYQTLSTAATSTTATTTTTKASIITTITSTATTITPFTTTTSSFTTTNSQTLSCGNPTIKPNDAMIRIIGGLEAVPNSWPWQVLITDNSVRCGASLINNNWLITAAHCVDGINMPFFRGFFGVHNRGLVDSNTPTRYIEAVYKNPKYIGASNSWDGDIALLKLKQPISYTSQISPICLPAQGEDLATLGKKGIVTGWGLTQGTGTDFVLRQTSITTQSITSCNANSANMICAGEVGLNKLSGACSGDSGGPFVMLKNNNYYLTGIVSWGTSDCSSYGVYTKVSNFVTWINSIITTK